MKRLARTGAAGLAGVDRWLAQEYDRRHRRRTADPEPPPPPPPHLPVGRFLATSGKRYDASELRAPLRLRSFFGLRSVRGERSITVRWDGADHHATVRGHPTGDRTPSSLAIRLDAALLASARDHLRSDALVAFFSRGDAFEMIAARRDSPEGRRIRAVWDARSGERGGVGRIGS